MLDTIRANFRTDHISMTPALAFNDASSKRKKSGRPTPTPHQKVLQTFNGSAALFQVAKALKLRKDDLVALPAYCCGAELGPFLHMGCRCIFFDVDEKLNVEIQQIETLLKEYGNVKVVLITHYFGICQKNLLPVSKLCKEHGAVLVEDCAHALFCADTNGRLGTTGNFAIFSPRKVLPMTEGGLMVSNYACSTDLFEQLKAPAVLPRWQRLFYSMQQNIRSNGEKYSKLKALSNSVLIALLYLPAVAIKVAKKLPMAKHVVWLTAEAEGQEAVPIYEVGMSAFSESVMHGADLGRIVGIRRRNYLQWLTHIERINSAADKNSKMLLTPLLTELPDGCCPLYFPIIVKDPIYMKQYMSDQNIECFSWWQHKHPAIDWTAFPVASKLKSCVLALPVHQKISEQQIQRMAHCLQLSIASDR